MINITERITALRLERKWSEYQLAEKSGITQSTISSWSRQNVVPVSRTLKRSVMPSKSPSLNFSWRTIRRPSVSRSHRNPCSMPGTV